MIILQIFGIKILISYFLDMTILFNVENKPSAMMVFFFLNSLYNSGA